MKTYSMDLRERVVSAVDAGKETQNAVAGRFGVSLAWVKKLLLQRKETGSIAPKPHGGGWTPKFEGERLETLKKLVEAQPDATLQELLDRSGVDASIMTVHRALQRLDCHFKKSPFTRPSRTARTSSKSARSGRPDNPDSTPPA